MESCINLLARYGDTYRITHDEAAESRQDPWMMQIPCRWGTIYPHGNDMLAVTVDYHPGIAKRVAAIPGVKLVQDGDAEKTFLFPAALFDAVACVVLPRWRRKLSVEHKARLAESNLAYRFQKTRLPEVKNDAQIASVD